MQDSTFAKNKEVDVIKCLISNSLSSSLYSCPIKGTKSLSQYLILTKRILYPYLEQGLLINFTTSDFNSHNLTIPSPNYINFMWLLAKRNARPCVETTLFVQKARKAHESLFFIKNSLRFSRREF